nr:hypothetical protein [uncultured bacterium]
MYAPLFIQLWYLEGFRKNLYNRGKVLFFGKVNLPARDMVLYGVVRLVNDPVGIRLSMFIQLYLVPASAGVLVFQRKRELGIFREPENVLARTDLRHPVCFEIREPFAKITGNVHRTFVV